MKSRQKQARFSTIQSEGNETNYNKTDNNSPKTQNTDKMEQRNFIIKQHQLSQYSPTSIISQRRQSSQLFDSLQKQSREPTQPLQHTNVTSKMKIILQNESTENSVNIYQGINSLISTVPEAKRPSLQLLVQQKNQFFQHMSQKEPQKGVDILLYVMKITIQKSSIALFEKCIEALGDVFLCCQDTGNAVGMYCIQKNLGDLTGNYDHKMRAYKNLANFCKGQQLFEQALKLYKKALEYAWFLNDDESEAQMYENIGIVYYLLSNFEKALFYHQRSVNHALEQENGSSKWFAKENIKKLIFIRQITIQKKISKYLLAKLGMIGNLNMDQVIFDDSSNNNLVVIRYTTNMSFEYQMDLFFQDIEFKTEIPSPKSAKPGKTENGKILKNCEIDFNQEILDIHKSVEKKRLLVVPKFRNSSSRVVLKPNILKKNLANSIEDRLQLKLDKVQQDQVRSSSSQKFFAPNTLNKFLYAHINPNRSIEGFKYIQKYNFGKLNKFFEEVLKLMVENQ